MYTVYSDVCDPFKGSDSYSDLASLTATRAFQMPGLCKTWLGSRTKGLSGLPVVVRYEHKIMPQDLLNHWRLEQVCLKKSAKILDPTQRHQKPRTPNGRSRIPQLPGPPALSISSHLSMQVQLQSQGFGLGCLYFGGFKVCFCFWDIYRICVVLRCF